MHGSCSNLDYNAKAYIVRQHNETLGGATTTVGNRTWLRALLDW